MSIYFPGFKKIIWSLTLEQRQQGICLPHGFAGITELTDQGDFGGQHLAGPFSRQDPLTQLFKNTFLFFAFFHSVIPFSERTSAVRKFTADYFILVSD